MHSPLRVFGWLVVVFLGATLLRAEPVLRVRADPWMPFNGGANDDGCGYVVELLRTIFPAKGITVDYQNLNWDEALKSVRAGEIEAVIGANDTEAAGLAVGKETVGAPRVALFVPKSSHWEYTNLSSLRTVKLGVIEGYSYWPALDDYLKNHSGSGIVVFGGATPLRDGIGKLNTGEIDVMAETVPVFVWTVKSAGFMPSDYRVAYSYEGTPIYVAFVKNETGARYAAIWDEGLAEMRRSGALAKLLKKYGLSDWK